MTDYPGNVTRDQFELIRVDLETFRKRTFLEGWTYLMSSMQCFTSFVRALNGVSCRMIFRNGKPFTLTLPCGQNH